MSSCDSSVRAGRPCPVCERFCDGPPLERYTVAQAAAHFCPETRDPDRNRRLRQVIERLWGGDECVVLRCASCGFAFGHPFVGGDEAFYSILHEQKGYPSWRWDYDFAIERALGSGRGGRVLDIGAGDGVFLRRLAPRWAGYAVEGSEITRSVLQRAGIVVFRDLHAAAEREGGSFEVVTLFQVLEHVAEFRHMLADCRRLLRPGGRLVVTVPDGGAMLRQPELIGLHDMPPNHINKFTPASLARALRQTGFAPDEAVYEPDAWSRVLWALHGRVIADATRPGTLAARVYGIRDKRLRAPMLALTGLLSLPRILRHARELRRGSTFAMIGVAGEADVSAERAGSDARRAAARA